MPANDNFRIAPHLPVSERPLAERYPGDDIRVEQPYGIEGESRVYLRSAGVVESLRRRLFDLEARYSHLLKALADGAALQPPAPLHIHRDEATVERLRRAIRHALADYGTADARKLLERALEESL